MRILGALVAGGRASRFGSDKALAQLAARPLIAWAAEVVAPFVAETVVCGRGWGGLASVADVPGPDLGPLGGLAGALAHAEAHGFEAVVSIGCDMPWVPDGLVAALVAARPAWCGDAPVLGCWPSSLARPLRAHLEDSGDRSVRRWGASVGGVAVASPVPLPNLNTPEALAAFAATFSSPLPFVRPEPGEGWPSLTTDGVGRDSRPGFDRLSPNGAR